MGLQPFCTLHHSYGNENDHSEPLGNQLNMSDSLDPAQYANNGVDRNEGDRIKERFLTALTRGTTTGCILRGGLTIFVSLLSYWSAKKRTTARHPFEEVVRMTLFLGSLSGIYVVVDEAIAALWGKRRSGHPDILPRSV